MGLVLIPVVAVYAYQDDLSVVFSSWSSGEPKIMVKLEIHIPPVDAESCGVVVRRLPTRYRPTKSGFSEEVYAGRHGSGEVVVVKQLLDAIVAKTKREGEYKVEYYEPAEYFVTVVCRKNELIRRYGKIHEVFPDKLVTTYRIEVSFEEPANEVNKESVGSYEPSSLPCVLTPVNPSPNVLEAAECYTWVRGPYLYSLPGLKTKFGLLGGPIPSAVYLESFSDAAYCFTRTNCDHDVPRWSSAGKKLTPSIISGETYELSGRWKDRVYFNVKYRYEKFFAGTMPIGILAWILYPVDIGDLELSATLPSVPYEKKYLTFIPPALSYSIGPVLGDRTLWFTPVSESNAVVSSIDISFSYSLGGWSATLTINLYKAGRSDSLYTTPYVSVKDVSENTRAWYYWWYSDNDPMTYEIQFSYYTS